METEGKNALLPAHLFDSGPCRTALVVALTLALGACASPQYNYVPGSTEVAAPPLNRVATAVVGAAIVEQGRVAEIASVRLNRETSVGILGSYTFAPGYYTMVGGDEHGEFYLPEDSPEGGKVTRSLLADPFEAIQITGRDNSWCGVTVFGTKACTDDADFERVRRPSPRTAGFQQALIYGGRIGNRIRLGYREFSNNRPRPAFDSDAEFDVANATVIRFKGAEIEVMDATDRSITYRVLRYFHDAAL